jgi:hypothetical protein
MVRDSHSERSYDINKPVPVDSGGTFTFFQENGEWLKTWIHYEGKDKIETTYGASESEVAMWLEIIRIRTALHESADLIRKLSLQTGDIL